MIVLRTAGEEGSMNRKMFGLYQPWALARRRAARRTDAALVAERHHDLLIARRAPHVRGRGPTPHR